jgi:hypothetical protein
MSFDDEVYNSCSSAACLKRMVLRHKVQFTDTCRIVLNIIKPWKDILQIKRLLYTYFFLKTPLNFITAV